MLSDKEVYDLRKIINDPTKNIQTFITSSKEYLNDSKNPRTIFNDPNWVKLFEDWLTVLQKKGNPTIT